MHCLAFARARPHIWALRDALWGAGAPTSPRANPGTIMSDRQHGRKQWDVGNVGRANLPVDHLDAQALKISFHRQPGRRENCKHTVSRHAKFRADESRNTAWRPRPESNRGARICSPLRNHSATRPHRSRRSTMGSVNRGYRSRQASQLDFPSRCELCRTMLLRALRCGRGPPLRNACWPHGHDGVPTRR